MSLHRIAPTAAPSESAQAPNRRQFMLASAGVGAIGLAKPEAAQAAGTVLEAYASAQSIVAGSGSLKLHARDPLASTTKDVSYPLTIVRLGHSEVVVMSTTVLLRNQSVPADATRAGCGWPVSKAVTIPAHWPSGLYLARFGRDQRGCEVPFVVRPAVGSSRAKVLVQVPFSTMQAYNPYGGKSLYEYNSSGRVPATKVSFDRPWQYQAYETNDPWMFSLVRWLSANGVSCDFCATADLHAEPTLLTGYRLLIIGGHDEYWSRPMRAAVDSFVNNKGNVAVLGGNTCWWQVRFESGERSKAPLRTLVCYKSRQADPSPTEATKTINWIDLNPAWPENATFGLGARFGSVWSNGLPRPPIPWQVKQADHWVFAGTGLGPNSSFGAAQVGYETDALAWRAGTDQAPYATGSDGAPAGVRILALADCTSWASTAQQLGSAAHGGYAVISLFSRGGTVFNTGSVDWALGLRQEMSSGSTNAIGTITRNVIRQLQAVYAEPADLSLRPVWQHSLPQANGDGRRHQLLCGQAQLPGWTADGIAFRAYALPQSNTQPVYRHMAAQANGDGRRYLFSLAPQIGNGWTADGIAFHVPQFQVPGAVLVYQHHAVQANGDGWRFLFSTRGTEPGWILDGPVFWALASA